MSTILLVEDNSHIMKINSEMLTMRGYEVVQAVSAEECRKSLHWHTVDLVVLDVMLPDGNGLALCREIKEQYHTPILFLSALGESKDIVDGLRAGGDDYLAKPYDLEVLAARIEARLRSREEASRYLCYGALKLDLVWGCGYLDDLDLLLTPREFSVLLQLTRNAETVMPTAELACEAWHSDDQASIHAVWTLISRLRKKLHTEKSRLEISSVRGTGYKLEQI